MAVVGTRKESEQRGDIQKFGRVSLPSRGLSEFARKVFGPRNWTERWLGGPKMGTEIEDKNVRLRKNRPSCELWHEKAATGNTGHKGAGGLSM